MSPQGGGAPGGELADLIDKSFGSYKEFQEKFTQEATKHFGSGWAWLVLNSEGKLSIVSTHDAANPMQDGLTPLLTCDVWEHAYYVDYRNARPKYLESWWKLVNWKFAENILKSKKSL
jgi:Fe-Mn family superoxide dismutase